jgi:eukaryotic-like serine/threonine-protein kinase
MAAHLHAPPPKVTDVAPGLSAQLDQVIAIAMAKDPAQRFNSARSLAEAAATALNDQTVQLTAPWQVPAPPAQPAAFYAPSAKRHSGGRIAAAVIAVAVVAAAAVAVVTLKAKPRSHIAFPSPTSSTTNTPPPPRTPPPVASAALSDLLLSAEQVAGLVGADALVQESFADTVIDDSQKLLQKDCIGVAAPDQHLVYADTGWTGARSQALRNGGDGPRSFAVIQAVIAFPSADEAKKLLAAQKSQWTSCSGRTLTLVFPAPPSPQLWTAGTPADTDGTLTMTQEMRDGGGMDCQRALAVRNNVAIDISACRYDVTNQAADILNAIAARIPH